MQYASQATDKGSDYFPGWGNLSVFSDLQKSKEIRIKID